MAHDYRWRASKAEVEVDFAVAFAAPTPPPAPPADDLTLIWGLGPKAARVLTAAGITHFETLAKMTGTWLEEVLGEAGYPTVSRIVATWPAQARLIREEAWETLATFQKSL
jgi:predicted flap endonuclease-1-like 5' DNA nuclease